MTSVRLINFLKKSRAGKNINDRPVLKSCLEFLREDDTLVIASIDRAARSLRDLLDIVKSLNDRGVSVLFIKENLKFPPDGDDAMGELMLNLLGSIAQFERALIKERQLTGIKSAQKRGVQFGRKRKLTDEQCEEIRQRNDNGESKMALAEEYGVGRQAIYHAIKRAEEAEKTKAA